MPKIDSSVMHLQVRAAPAVAVRDEQFFIELLKALFAQRRKTVLNNLRAARSKLALGTDAALVEVLAEAQIDPRRRAETLSLGEMAALATALQK